MTNNDHGGRKEATGVWAWKMDTLQPGENITLTYSLDGLEKAIGQKPMYSIEVVKRLLAL